ncbi:hypothetical protein QQF64_028757 [Cirrhinus molitorella]|uniref:Uncharacterized protein n=1 Tax=Cirrhinus molitorella TaxID=172907 RepID=A0ABR3N7K8_9TELE
MSPNWCNVRPGALPSPSSCRNSTSSLADRGEQERWYNKMGLPVTVQCASQKYRLHTGKSSREVGRMKMKERCVFAALLSSP